MGKLITTPAFKKSIFFLLSMLFLLAGTNSAYALTRTYNISQSDLVNCGTQCGSTYPSWFNNGSGAIGFNWADDLPSTYIITDVSIQFYVGIHCAGNYTPTLNGVTQTTFSITT